MSSRRPRFLASTVPRDGSWDEFIGLTTRVTARVQINKVADSHLLGYTAPPLRESFRVTASGRTGRILATKSGMRLAKMVVQ